MTQMIDKAQIITVDKKSGRVRVRTHNQEPTLTQQQFKDECDINNIIKKYENTGEFTHRTSKVGQYADFSNIQDYQTMVETVQYAQEAFSSLPATVRARFENDPGKLLEFVQDSKNYDEGVKLGIVTPKSQTDLQTQPQTPTPSQTNTPTNPKNQP